MLTAVVGVQHEMKGRTWTRLLCGHTYVDPYGQHTIRIPVEDELLW